MADRIQIGDDDGQFIDVSNKLANRVREYAMANNLRMGDALVDYVDEHTLTFVTDEEE